MSSGVDGAVQATAWLAAACRDAESRSTRPRLHDPYAGRFAAGGGEVVARTVLVDQLLGAEFATDPPAVVVNLGAGFCARPYRLDLSGCRLVLELDDPDLLAIKQRVLAGEPASAPVRRVPMDLRDHERLAACLAAECGEAEPVVLVSEGLLPYLPAEAVAGLAGALAASLPRARWLTDLVSLSSARQMATAARAAGAAVPLHGLADLSAFTATGWEVVDYRILPVARRGPLGAAGRGGGAVAGRSGGPASCQVVDGVVRLRRGVPLR